MGGGRTKRLVGDSARDDLFRGLALAAVRDVHGGVGLVKEGGGLRKEDQGGRIEGVSGVCHRRGLKLHMEMTWHNLVGGNPWYFWYTPQVKE